LDGQVRLLLAAINEPEVVEALGPVRVQLDAPAQNRDGVVELVEEIVYGAEVDVGHRPEWVEPRDFLEVVRRAGQVLHLKANGRQAVVNVRGIGTDAERLQIKLTGFLPFPLLDRLARSLA